MTYQIDRVAELYGAVARQALRDHFAGWQRRGTPSAYLFLRSAGLVDQRGRLVGRAQHFALSSRKKPRKPIAAPAALGA